MKITRRRLRLQSTAYAEDSLEPRSDGAHVSAILWSMQQDMKSMLGGSKNRKSGVSEDDLQDYARHGFMWEHILSRTWAEVEEGITDGPLLRPGEFGWCVTCQTVMPGKRCAKHCIATGHRAIYATPDGIWINADGDVLAEYKSTWKSETSAVTPSENENLDEATDWVEDRTMEFGQWRWVMQVKCYCFLLGTVVCIFRVMFVNGAYSPPRPSTWEFKIEFDSDEIMSAWHGVVRHAQAKGWV